ncbi:MAG TPA: putative Ig domain-containing protein [Steroidobacteraceae bacterium]
MPIFPRFVLAFSCAFVVLGSARAQIASQNINMVSGTSFPTGDPYLQRQNEPSIAASSRNPSRLMAGANDYRSVNIPAPAGVTDETGDAWLGVFKSFDGGQTWQSNLLPGYPQDTSSVGVNSPLHGFTTGADPVVRAGTNGLFYYSGIVFNRGTNQGSVFVSRFIDLANKENGDPIQYLDAHLIDSGTSGQFLDKPWLAVDIPRGSATCTIQTTEDGKSVSQTIPAGNAYITYSAFIGGTNNTHTQVLVARSTDCGQTWTKPVKVSESYQVNQGSTLAVDPRNGTLYVAWRQFSSSSSPNAILVAQSTDGGNTFSKVTTVASFPDFNPSSPNLPAFFEQGISPTSFRTDAFPSLAIDGNGRLYLAWSQRGVNGTPDGRIVMTSSPDGVSWATPAPVDNSPITDSALDSFNRGSQLMPSVTYTGGKLMVLYYDLRLDHTVGIFAGVASPSVNPLTVLYNETNVPITSTSVPGANIQGTDAPQAIFTPFISDAGLFVRHTMDVRLSQADPPANSTAPLLFTSIPVSQYNFGSYPGQPSDDNLHQLQVNPPNLPMFQGGTVPFMGDYIEVSGPAFVSPAQSGAGWQFNTATDATGLATWTSNQDVRPPVSGDWTQTTSPDCPIAPLLDGSRNQNIYFSRITQGLSFTAPQQSKPLSTTLPRAFVLDLFNSTDLPHTFALTFKNLSANVYASFATLPTPLPATLPTPSSQIFVTLPPRSGATRSVFALSANTTAAIQIQANESNPDGSPYSGSAAPLSGFVVLNADPTVPALINPDNSPTGSNIQTVELYTPNISNPNISNPNISNLTIANPNISNPNISNPNISNISVANLDVANSTIANPNISNPNISNPNISNPNISNPNISNVSVSDINYTVTNHGNTNSGYQVRLVQLTSSLPGNPKIQLILGKSYNNPVSSGCQLHTQNTNIPVANLTDPATIDYTQVGNNTSNETDPEKNATLHLAPGESGTITIRGYTDENTMQSIASVLIPAVLPEPSFGTNNVAAPLTLVPATLKFALQGSAYSFTFAAFGGTAPYTWTSSGLPSGFTLDSATGTLTKDASSGPAPGIYTFTVQIKDVLGVVTTRTYSIVVVAPLAISTTTLPNGVVGSTTYTTTLASTGGTPPVTWTVTAGALPAGLVLDASTGTIHVATGKTLSATGTYTFTVTATDSSPGTPLIAQKTFTIQVYTGLTFSFTSLPDAVLGVPYTATLSATGGSGTYTWAVTSGSLPALLTLKGSVISGTPTTVNTAGTPFTLTVTDTSQPPQSASSTYVIPVSGALQITTASLPSGQVNVAYPTTVLQAAGGIAPLTWSLASGTLPAGISLSSGGAISGTPTVAGSFPFTVRVTDASSPAQTATHTYTITIPKPLTLTFTTQPSNSSPNSQITPSIKVQVVDSTGKAIRGATVTLGIASGTTGAVLSGSTSAVTGNNGIAIFASNSINLTGSYQLSATATYQGSTGSVLSTTFSIR